MVAVYVVLGLISSVIASYASALGLVFVFNMFFRGIPMDVFAFLQCPLTAACVEFGAEFQTAVLTMAAVIFVLFGAAAPAVYYRLSKPA